MHRTTEETAIKEHNEPQELSNRIRCRAASYKGLTLISPKSFTGSISDGTGLNTAASMASKGVSHVLDAIFDKSFHRKHCSVSCRHLASLAISEYSAAGRSFANPCFFGA